MIDPESLEDLYEQAPVGYLTVTAEEMIFRVNKTLLQWTGWKVEELVGRKWYEVLLTPAGRAYLQSSVDPLVELQDHSREIAVDCVCADGERLPVLMYIVRKGGSQGAPVFHRITVVEATERRSYERRLLEAKQAAEHASRSLHALITDLQERVQTANEALNAFSHGSSHLLKDHVRRVLAFSHALSDDCGDQLHPKGRAYLERIDQEGRAMSDLIEALLQLSNSARVELRRETVDVSTLAEKILRDLAAREPARRVSWTIEPALTLFADAHLLKCALRHLLENAWKFTAHTPEPSIRLYSQTDGDRQLICITDNGVGFELQNAFRLFRPFQKLHRVEVSPGAGIGLATVQRIIRRHGGAVDATAAPGEGATFRFWLPDEGLGAVRVADP